MCQVPLISVPDYTYQFQHVYRLGIRKYIEMCQVRLKGVPDDIYPVQPVCKLQIRENRDMLIMINNRF